MIYLGTFYANFVQMIKRKREFLLPITSSDRDTIRTCDRLLRRQMLYPAELRDLLKNANVNKYVYLRI